MQIVVVKGDNKPNLYIEREILAETFEHQEETYVLFIDFGQVMIGFNTFSRCLQKLLPFFLHICQLIVSTLDCCGLLNFLVTLHKKYSFLKK